MSNQVEGRPFSQVLPGRVPFLTGSTAAVLAVALLGFYFRTDGFTASLWLDEFGTLWAVEQDFVTMVSRSWQFQGQSPLYYAFVWTSVRLLGESEAALRFPSLLAGILLPWALSVPATFLNGPKAGCVAAVFGWLSVFAIRASVDARPYALSLLGVALAVAAFQCVVRSGTRNARIAWILTGAFVAWSHYVQYLTVLGLLVSYFLLADLRRHYPLRRFLLDSVAQVALVSVCALQLADLFSRRHALSWLDAPDYGVFLVLLLPLMPAIVVGELLVNRGDDPTRRALRRSLWVCLITHVVVLEIAYCAGVNLLAARYFIAILVPGVLLAATGLARIGRPEASAALLGFVLITGWNLRATKLIAGNYSGAGVQDWRTAVSTLALRLQREPGATVLFRSGFVEEDVAPRATPVGATLAPLRSPGQPAFRWPVRSLTYRWGTGEQQKYYDAVVRPLIARSAKIFVLMAGSSPGSCSYPERFATWVHEEWPAQFHLARERFGSVELMTFSRQPR